MLFVFVWYSGVQHIYSDMADVLWEAGTDTFASFVHLLCNNILSLITSSHHPLLKFTYEISQA